ncbi:hypothetical protein Q1695_001379 [Nippostrongylus brasiliensis]|nr:hypothetical protein Q1695_001379 [Nippostrongylus brasiliensis]
MDGPIERIQMEFREKNGGTAAINKRAESVNETEKKLNALKEEKMRLEKLKKVDDQELEELKERCKLQES